MGVVSFHSLPAGPFPLRLTPSDSSAYSPFRDPTLPSDCPDRVGVFETEGPTDSSRTGSGSWPGEISVSV